MSKERYEDVAGAKTASLYAAACELGARYPGGNEELGREMSQLGWNLGLSFQIIDDCLDLTATTEELGKTAGTDVEDGKVTLPVLYTYAQASEAERGRIRDVFTVPGLEGRARRLREVCDLGPGIEYTMARACDLVARARQRLQALPAGAARTALERIGDFVLHRNW